MDTNTTSIDVAHIAAVAAVSGAIGGALIAGAVQLAVGMMNTRQRKREQLIERAFDMASTEFAAHLEEGRRRADAGLPDVKTAAFSHYFTFNLILLDQLSNLHSVKKLDADTITRAMDHATDVASSAMARRAADGLAREKRWQGARAGEPAPERQARPD